MDRPSLTLSRSVPGRRFPRRIYAAAGSDGRVTFRTAPGECELTLHPGTSKQVVLLVLEPGPADRALDRTPVVLEGS